MTQRSYVKNGSDAEQVRKAGHKESLRLTQEREDIAFLMGTRQGRRFFWRLLSECQTFTSIFDPHGSRMSYNSGRQDVGHWLMAEAVGVDPASYLLMQREAAQMAAELPEPPTMKDTDG